MKMTEFMHLILIFYFTILVSTQRLSPGNEPMLLIGLYEQCEEKVGDFLRSNVCRKAIDCAYRDKQNHWDEYLKEREFDLVDGFLSMKDIEYRKIEFCGSDEALSIAIDLRLNSSYFVSNRTERVPVWNRRPISSWQFSSRIILLIIEAPRIISRLLAELFYSEDFVVVLADNETKLPKWLLDRNVKSNRNAFQMNARSLLDALNPPSSGFYNKVKRFALIEIQSESIFYQLDFEYFKNILDGKTIQ